MYSMVLMLSMATADQVPQGILFNRGAGCNGTVAMKPVRNAAAGVVAAVRNRPHLALVRNAGCNVAQASSGCNGSTTVSLSTVTASYQKMPVTAVPTVERMGAGPVKRAAVNRQLRVALRRDDNLNSDQKATIRRALADPDVYDAAVIKVNTILEKQLGNRMMALGDGHILQLLIDNLPAIISAIKSIISLFS